MDEDLVRNEKKIYFLKNDDNDGGDYESSYYYDYINKKVSANKY